MALAEAPVSIDVTDIQFKLHSKYQLFNSNASTPAHNGVNLLATASAFGLVIVGRPSSTEIEVLLLRDVVEKRESQTVPYRTINLPGEPYSIALNCDHTMLSVCYTANGPTFMDIYAVQSFLSNNVRCLVSKLMVSNDPNVKVKEIHWNPVIGNTMALCLGDGTLGAYVIKENSFEYNSIDKSENARCACWSPKGKQIVVAFPNGKLAQYKPDLKLAKTIPCTVRLFPGPFLPIAVQWLSTYQFAVVFVEDKDDTAQSLFIVNAPKNIQPTYINYYDINYSQSGPRAPQVFLVHILPWNLILMGSSNGTEVGALGTDGNGETPLWTQYTFLDEARAELPLTADKQDTFPVGLALETGSTHKLVIGENEIPVMPMLHILSTHGFLLSFDLLNFQPTRVDICSPPQNIADQSGLQQFQMRAIDSKPNDVTSPQEYIGKPFPSNELHGNLTFSVPGNAVTSTPEKPPAQSLLQPKSVIEKPTVGNLSSFGSSSGGLTGLGLKETSKLTPAIQQIPAQTTMVPNAKPTVAAADINNKPFLTVKSNYKPNTQTASNKAPSSSLINSLENDAILRKMIAEEIEAFEKEIHAALSRSKGVEVNVCSKEELSQLMKNIDELQEITSQATETTESLKSDVQSLKLTLYEMLAMSAEAKSKTDDFNRSTISSDDGPASSQAHRRYLEKLQSLLIQTQRHFDTYNKQIDAHWSDHIQQQRENDRDRMRVPTLEAVYQTLAKQYQILMKEKEKINKIKAKVGMKDSTQAKIKYSYSKSDNLKVNSLIDSVISLTIGDQIKNERKALKSNKVEELRRATISNRNINLVKPSRPDRKGLNSEIIIEQRLAQEKQKKLEAERAQKTSAQVVVSKSQMVPAQSLPAETVQTVKTSNPSFGLSITSATPISFAQNATVEKPQSQQPEPLTKVLTPSGSGIAKEAEIPSGFSFGGKTETTTAPLNFPSFGNLSTNKQISLGNITVTKLSTASTETKATALAFGTTIAGSNESKTISTPSFVFATTKENPVTTASASSFSFNLGTLNTKSNFTATPVSISNSKPIEKPSIPNVATPVISSALIKTTTSSIGSFSFSLGGDSGAETMTPTNPTVTLASVPEAVLISTPSTVSSSIGTTTTSASSRFSFAKAASTGTSNFETSLYTSTAETPKATTTAASTTSSSVPSSNANDPSSIFQGFNTCKPNVSETANVGKNIFGGNSFGTAAAVATSPTSSASIFGGITVNTLSAASPSISTAGASIFGNKASIPSTAASVPPTNLFAAKAAEMSTSEAGDHIFGGKATDSTSSISFGGFGLGSASSSSSAPKTGNIFGSLAPTSPNQNVFGNASSNVFGSPTSTSSIFGGAAINTSSTPSGNIFNSPAAIAGTVPTSSTASIFGGQGINTGSSIFGGGANTTSSPGSIFGNTVNNGNAFGGGTQNSMSAGSIFGGSGGFGSPTSQPQQQQQQSSMFGGGVFAQSENSQPTFTSSAFGLGARAAASNPSFGSGPTFGSPKGFGTFGSNVQAPAFVSPTKGNNLFESLGASENAMTFGNLAQTQNTPPQQPKQFGGGSSFSSWR